MFQITVVLSAVLKEVSVKVKVVFVIWSMEKKKNVGPSDSYAEVVLKCSNGHWGKLKQCHIGNPICSSNDTVKSETKITNRLTQHDHEVSK